MLPPSWAIPCQSAEPCWETIANVEPSSSQRLRVPSSMAHSSRGQHGWERDRELIGTRSPRAGRVRDLAAEPVAAADYGPLGLFSGSWAGDVPEHRARLTGSSTLRPSGRGC